MHHPQKKRYRSDWLDHLKVIYTLFIRNQLWERKWNGFTFISSALV